MTPLPLLAMTTEPLMQTVPLGVSGRTTAPENQCPRPHVCCHLYLSVWFWGVGTLQGGCHTQMPERFHQRSLRRTPSPSTKVIRKGQWLHSIEATYCSVREWRKTECQKVSSSESWAKETRQAASRKRSKHQLKEQLFSWRTDHRSWDQMTSNRDGWQKTVRWAAKIFASFWGETTGKEGFREGSYPLSETIFQDFFRTQIDFSRAPKCTIIEALNPYEIEKQK